jgi:hypothetical protein
MKGRSVIGLLALGLPGCGNNLDSKEACAERSRLAPPQVSLF